MEVRDTPEGPRDSQIIDDVSVSLEPEFVHSEGIWPGNVGYHAETVEPAMSLCCKLSIE